MAFIDDIIRTAMQSLSYYTQPITQSIIQSIIQSITQSIIQSIIQSIKQSITQSIIQSIIQSYLFYLQPWRIRTSPNTRHSASPALPISFPVYCPCQLKSQPPNAPSTEEEVEYLLQPIIWSRTLGKNWNQSGNAIVAQPSKRKWIKVRMDLPMVRRSFQLQSCR